MKKLLAQLSLGQSLSQSQAVEAFEQIMTGAASPAQVAAMLSMIQLRGPEVSEIVGAAQVLRAHVRPVKVSAEKIVVDTCGTGGDHAQTFNVSTAAAIVAAGAARGTDVVVAKHGNRSVTSQSGSSQVLETLGVRLDVSDQTLTRCLDEAGMCFCFAPAHHPAMRHVAAVRQELGFRTLFNMVGPLTNPAGATCQVVGVFSSELTGPIANALQQLGAHRAMVVHGQASDDSQRKVGLDELSTCGVNTVSYLFDGQVRTHTVDPREFGFSATSLDRLRVDSPKESAAVIRGVLAGQEGGARDIVCLNAGSVLIVAGLTDDFAEAVAMAAQAIDQGAAAAVLENLVRLTQTDSTDGS